MNFYTLTFDANNPTKQQLNIPTNTDYTVGVKVVKDGAEQTIAPTAATLGTLSADANKTNGYITFTESAGDEPSFTEKKLAIDTTDYVAISVENTATSRGTRCNILSAQLEPYADRTLFGSNIRIEYKPNADADFEDINYDAMTGINGVLIYDSVAQFNKYAWFGNAVFEDTGAANKRFMEYADPSTIDGWVDSIKLEGITQIGFSWTPRNNPQVFPKFQFNESAANPLVVRMTLNTGDLPFVATFKLNENIYKAQCGDLADIDYSSTVNIAGTLPDNTPFDYNVVIK